MATEGRRPLSESDLMKVTFVEVLSSALASAPFAMRLRIDLYVLAKKRFSEKRESSHMWQHFFENVIRVPTNRLRYTLQARKISSSVSQWARPQSLPTFEPFGR